MPWQEVSTVSLRQELVVFATEGPATVRELCRRYGVSAKTAYKWLARYAGEGVSGLRDRSRRPHGSPRQTRPALEAAVLAVRAAHPEWGGRKIRHVLLRRGVSGAPAPSTITAILRRHGLLASAAGVAPHAFTRFEHATPNELWQMDFKGHFALPQGRCHPLTILDDHSRFAVGLRACGNEQGTTVQQCLQRVFRRYGLPRRMLMDNGAPWGSDRAHPYTPLTAWLLRLGIRVSHGRPYHPQTQGKTERFHRTLKAELLTPQPFRDLLDCQTHFDRWRQTYNLERPHQALAYAVPASRYQPSPRRFPETLPPIVYGPDDLIRKVQADGAISYRAQAYLISKAFRGYPVALRPTSTDGQFDVYFCHHRVTQLDVRHPRDSPASRMPPG